MKLSPKQLERMAKRMGLQTQTIEATEVIIKTPEKEIIISNPSVAKLNIMGQESFQITGEVSEIAGISKEDVKTVAEKSGASEEDARKALEESNGDLAEAILKLKNSKQLNANH